MAAAQAAADPGRTLPFAPVATVEPQPSLRTAGIAAPPRPRQAPAPVHIVVPQPRAVKAAAVAPSANTGAPRQVVLKTARAPVPSPTPVLAPPVPRQLHVDGSLKDGPASRSAHATIVTTGAVALTAYRGDAPLPLPAFLSQPLLSSVDATGSSPAMPAWAHAWLVDHAAPGDSFRGGQ